jgi:hypothetical protein
LESALSLNVFARKLGTRVLWGGPVDQFATVLTDGGDSIRVFFSDLPSGSEHHLDRFHIAMRLTRLGQYGLAHHNPIEATALQHRLDRI